MTTTPVPPVVIPEELRGVVSTTFTYSCAWGCTVSVVESAEQPHMCVGLQVVGALAPELPWKRVCEVTHGLEPLVRTLVGHDGVQQARPDDPVTGPYDASIDDLPRTTITVVPDGHVDDVGCPCGPTVDPVAGLMHSTSLAGSESSVGVELIAAERSRQQTEEGYDQQHDTLHNTDQLAQAAAAYLCHDTVGMPDVLWPWDSGSFKPAPREEHDGYWTPANIAARTRDLTKAGALIAAEIDRLQALR